MKKLPWNQAKARRLQADLDEQLLAILRRRLAAMGMQTGASSSSGSASSSGSSGGGCPFHSAAGAADGAAAAAVAAASGSGASNTSGSSEARDILSLAVETSAREGAVDERELLSQVGKESIPAHQTFAACSHAHCALLRFGCCVVAAWCRWPLPGCGAGTGLLLTSSVLCHPAVVPQMKTFFAAGHDTTASLVRLLHPCICCCRGWAALPAQVQPLCNPLTLCLALTLRNHLLTHPVQVAWAVWFLCNHPEAEARLVAELQAVAAAAAAEDGGSAATDSSGSGAPTFTWQQLQQCQYLNAVLKETLRVRPPVGVFARRAPAGATLEGGGDVYDIGGKVLLVSPFVLHRGEAWGPDAAEWRPERWLEGSSANAVVAAQPYCYLPFSRGPRCGWCVGRGRAGWADGSSAVGCKDRGSTAVFSQAGGASSHTAATCPSAPPPRNCIGEKFAMLEAKTILAMLYSTFEFEYAGSGPEQVGLWWVGRGLHGQVRGWPTLAARGTVVLGKHSQNDCHLSQSRGRQLLGKWPTAPTAAFLPARCAGPDERDGTPPPRRAAARATAGRAGAAGGGWVVGRRVRQCGAPLRTRLTCLCQLPQNIFVVSDLCLDVLPPIIHKFSYSMHVCFTIFPEELDNTSRCGLQAGDSAAAIRETGGTVATNY